MFITEDVSECRLLSCSSSEEVDAEEVDGAVRNRVLLTRGDAVFTCDRRLDFAGTCGICSLSGWNFAKCVCKRSIAA